MLQLLDLNKNKIAGLTEYKDLRIESVLKTGDKTLSFSYYKDCKFYNSIVEEGYIKTKQDEFVIKEKNPKSNYTTFICKLNVEELEGKTFDRFESKEQTITAALNLAIVGTGWTVQDNNIKKKRTIRKTNCSSWEIIQNIKSTYRVDIEFDTINKKIKVYEHLGEYKGTYFTDDLNLKNLQIQSNSYDYATRMIPVGKDGITIEDVNNGKNYVENYQYSNKIKTVYWKDERYTIKENLKEDAIAKLNEISKPYKAYSVEAINLAKFNKKYKDVLDYKLGDIIYLISKSNKVKEKQRIVKIVEYPDEPIRDLIELSNTILKFEDIQTQFQETTDTVNNITTDNGTINGSTVDSIEVKQIEDFKANVVEVVNLKAINASINNLHTNKADIQDLHAVTAKIGALETTKASITELNAINAVIQNLKTGKADISELNAAVSKIGILESKTSSIDNLLAQKADIKDLNALNANISDALIKKANVAELEALETKTNKLIANKANISDLNSTNANINSLKADAADIKTLINGNLSSENIQTGGITSDKLTISDGFIKDAMIDSINVNKLNAGVLTTDKFNIRSRDGNLIIKDNTIQIKDSSKVRVQVGKDDSGDYSLYVWDKLGNLMFNALGITKDAIKDKIIRNDMVSDDAAIEGKKLNIESVIREVNNGKSNLKASKIDIDTKGQTLDIAFSNLVTENGKNKEEIVSLITKLNVQQGQINASIENSKVLEGKQKILEDNYNRTVVTVDSLKNTIGSHKTLIDSATEKITSVEVKANTLEKDLSGLTQTVTDTKKVIENNKTSLESKNAELKANIDKVSSSLSSVSSTVDKNNKTLVSKTNTLEQTLNGLAQTVSSNKSTTDEKISNVENVTHELKTGLSGLTSKLDTLKSSTDGINKTVINQGSVINQLQDSIKLKVDNQTFTQSTSTINKNINNLNGDLVSKINSSLSTAKSYSDSKKQEAINSANSHADSVATNKANESLNNAKAYTNAQVTTVNSNLSKATSEINILKNQISTKVGQVDIDRSIQDIKIGGRNLIKNSNFCVEVTRDKFANNYPSFFSIVDDFDLNSLIGKQIVFSYYISNMGDRINATSSLGGRFGIHGCIVFEKTDGGEGIDYPFAQCLEIKNMNNTRVKMKTTIDLPKDCIGIKSFTFSFQPYAKPKDNNNIWKLGYPKLEIGDKATDWTPAPEDADKLILDNIKVVTDKINDVSTKFIQAKDSLQASVNSLNSTTQTITTNLTKTNNDLSNKINIAKTDAINSSKSYADTKKNEAISSANSHADSVATTKANTAQSTAIAHADSKANDAKNQAINSANAYTNAQITTVNTRVSNAESSINILKGQISTKVSQSDIDKTVNNIQIGGRNLILYSKDLNNKNYYFLGSNNTKEIVNIKSPLGINDKAIKLTTSKSTNNEIFRLHYVVKRTGIYTFSCWYKSATNNNQQVHFDICDQVANNQNCIATQEWKKLIITSTVSRCDKTYHFVDIEVAKGNSVIIYNPKLETGTKATDWTPAPEDIGQEIKDNITTVTTKISNVESNLKQTKDSLQASVESISVKANNVSNSLNETKNDLLNKLNSAIDTSKKYADEVAVAKADLARQQAIANADGKITAEEQKRIQQAQDNLNIALNKADAAKAEAVNLSKQYANTQLNNAKDYTNSEVASVKSQITVDLNGIKTEVSKKVDSGNIMSSINQSAESIKINASKIQLDGCTTLGNNEGKFVRINNANYTIRDNQKEYAFFGFQRDEKNGHPKLTLGADGLEDNQNYLTIHANPSTDIKSYAEISYRIGEKSDYSNLKMYGGGDIKVAPLYDFAISSNCINGAYQGQGEYEIARFSSSNDPAFDGNLQIPCVRNMNAGRGLILGDFHLGSSKATCVRIQTDDDNNHYLRPLNENGDIQLGSPSYRWYRLYSKYSTSVSSHRHLKTNIAKFNDTVAYNKLKDINIYTFNLKKFDKHGNVIGYDNELCLGTMIDELPIECCDTGNTNLEKQGVDMYGYTSFLASALKVAINKIENLEKEIKVLKH